MQADFAVELGSDDETLEFPWTTADDGPRYYNLKREPNAIANIVEAARVTELGDFLLALNSPASMLESAKCDTWSSSDINPEEEIFDAPWKFGSYVDLLFSDASARFSFEDHQRLLTKLITLLKRAPEIPASAEFLLRRCYYHENDDLRAGYYVTFYLLGYGREEARARQQWAIALKLVSNAVGQLSSNRP